MKKTLAAVLAAAMALSTATVALAKDKLDGETNLEDISVADGRTEIRYGKEYSFVLSADVLEGTNISALDLGKWVKNGDANVTVTVTEGMAKMASKPSATVKNVITSETVVDSYKWDFTDYKKSDNSVVVGRGKKFEIKKGGKTIVAHGKTINGIPVTSDGAFTLTPEDVDKVIYPKDAGWKDLRDAIVDAHFREDSSADPCIAIDKTSLSVEKSAPVVQIKFKVEDDWGTGTANIGMKFRITFKKDVKDSDGEVIYSKGDTVMADEVLFKATYYKMNDKGTEMELTRPECGDRYVLLNKDNELYDKIDNDEFTLYFENIAAFTGKMSPSQKTLNMYYSTDEISEIKKEYPSVDFEFIEFKGKPNFVNTGKMTFSAIGGSDTQVYEWDGEALTPMNGSYNKTYNTVEVKGIKRLGTYVVASEILEVEEEPEEPAEPVDSAPSIEDNKDDEGGNPNTGAC